MQHNLTEQSPVSSRKLSSTITQIYSLRSPEGLKPRHMSLYVLLNYFYHCLTFVHSETAIIHIDKTAIRSSDCSYYLPTMAFNSTPFKSVLPIFGWMLYVVHYMRE